MAETRLARRLDNPYVGLRPFESHESVLFFGRDEQTVELLQRLHHHGFVAVGGSSGSGKSSLVRAGLIPKLEGGFLVADRHRWHLAVMKPGDHPRHSLAAAVLAVTSEAAGQEEIGALSNAMAAAGAGAVVEVLAPLLAESDANLLLEVDQFEEIFRFAERRDGRPADEALDFVAILLDLVRRRELPIYVVTTMRSDFLGDCDVFHGLPEALNRSQYLVPRLSREDLRTAIVGPARLFGAEVSSSLVALLNDAGEHSDRLPVIQHALMRTWQIWCRDGQGPITHELWEKDQQQKDLKRARERERKALLGVTVCLIVVSLLFVFALRQSSRAQKKTLEANFYLAQVFEEKAGTALARARESEGTRRDHENAWLYSLAALAEDVGDRRLLLSAGRLSFPDLRSQVFREIWRSPRFPGAILSVTFAHDGRRLASGYKDETIVSGTLTVARISSACEKTRNESRACHECGVQS